MSLTFVLVSSNMTKFTRRSFLTFPTTRLLNHKADAISRSFNKAVKSSVLLFERKNFM